MKRKTIVFCVLLVLLILSFNSCSNIFSEIAGTSGKTEYYVTFNANGGTPDLQSVKLIEPLLTTSLPTEPTKEGYTFTGWNFLNDGTGKVFNSETAVTGSTTVYAQWRGVPYKVVFNKNNDNASGTMEDQSFNVGITQALSANSYTQPGYHVIGWATTQDGNIIYSDSESVSNLTMIQDTVITLYAKWSDNSYSVTFDGNGSTGGSMSSQTFIYDEPAKALIENTYTKTGYTFTGWSITTDGTVTYTDEQDVQNLIATNGGSYTLYAVWTPNTVQPVTVILASTNEASIGLTSSGTKFTANSGFSSYRWYLDGVLVSGEDTTSNTYTYTTTNLSVGNHIVMVLVNGNRTATATLWIQTIVAY